MYILLLFIREFIRFPFCLISLLHKNAFIIVVMILTMYVRNERTSNPFYAHYIILNMKDMTLMRKEYLKQDKDDIQFLLSFPFLLCKDTKLKLILNFYMNDTLIKLRKSKIKTLHDNEFASYFWIPVEEAKSCYRICKQGNRSYIDSIVLFIMYLNWSMLNYCDPQELVICESLSNNTFTFPDSRYRFAATVHSLLLQGVDHLIIDNKKRFYEACVRYNIREIPVKVDLRLQLPKQIFVKPILSSHGIGSHLFEQCSNAEYKDETGKLFSTEELRKYLVSIEDIYCIQNRIENCKLWRKVVGDVVSSLRILTYYHLKPSLVDVPFALRCNPCGITDNYFNPDQHGYIFHCDHQGNILNNPFYVDLKTSNRVEIQKVFPDSIPVLQAKVPLIKESIDLALLAHSKFKDFPFLSWDIALTDNGPIILECNVCGSLTIAHQIKNYSLLNSSYIDLVLQKLN